jgi:hypothetical protein
MSKQDFIVTSALEKYFDERDSIISTISLLFTYRSDNPSSHITTHTVPELLNGNLVQNLIRSLNENFDFFQKLHDNTADIENNNKNVLALKKELFSLDVQLKQQPNNLQGQEQLLEQRAQKIKRLDELMNEKNHLDVQHVCFLKLRDELLSVASCVYTCCYHSHLSVDNVLTLIRTAAVFLDYKTENALLVNTFAAISSLLLMTIVGVFDPRNFVYSANDHTIIPNPFIEERESVLSFLNELTTVSFSVNLRALLQFCVGTLLFTSPTLAQDTTLDGTATALINDNISLIFPTFLILIQDPSWGFLSLHHRTLFATLDRVVGCYFFCGCIFYIKKINKDRTPELI